MRAISLNFHFVSNFTQRQTKNICTDRLLNNNPHRLRVMNTFGNKTKVLLRLALLMNSPSEYNVRVEHGKKADYFSIEYGALERGLMGYPTQSMRVVIKLVIRMEKG